MNRRKKIIAGLATALLIFSAFPLPPHSSALDLSVFRTKAEIVIQESKIDATLTDYPVLLTEASIPEGACDADGAHPAEMGGGDIRFTSDSAGTTQLPVEIVKFVTDNNPANCDAEIWVKVPSISGSANTSIWMWYDTASDDDQPTPSSTYGRMNVWDSNFKAVYHFQETSGSRSGATLSPNILTDNATVSYGSGKVGNGADFEKTNSEYLSITDGSQTGLDITGNLTFSAWVKPESHDQQTQYMTKYNSSGNQRGYFFYRNSDDNNLTTGISSNGVNITSALSSWTPTDGTWYHVSMAYDASAGEVTYYVNGSQLGSTLTGLNTSIYSNTADFLIGAFVTGSSYDSFFDGIMDEAHLSATERSAAWIKAEYENTNDPASFAIEGTPTDVFFAPSESTKRKPDDQSSAASSTVLQEDEDFKFDLSPGKFYTVYGAIFASSASAIPDLKIAFSGSTLNSSVDIGYMSQGGNTREAGLLELWNTASSTIPITASNVTILQIFGTVKAGSGNRLELTWAQDTSSATVITLKEGSFLTVTEISP